MNSLLRLTRATLATAAVGLLVVAVEKAAPVRGAAPPQADASPSATVEIDNFAFKPRELAVKPGTTVTWVNHDDVPHTATANGKSPAFNSRTLDTDEKYSFTFKESGTYPYFCKIHPHMAATVIVK